MSHLDKYGTISGMRDRKGFEKGKTYLRTTFVHKWVDECMNLFSIHHVANEPDVKTSTKNILNNCHFNARSSFFKHVQLVDFIHNNIIVLSMFYLKSGFSKLLEQVIYLYLETKYIPLRCTNRFDTAIQMVCT